MDTLSLRQTDLWSGWVKEQENAKYLIIQEDMDGWEAKEVTEDSKRAFDVFKRLRFGTIIRIHGKEFKVFVDGDVFAEEVLGYVV